MVTPSNISERIGADSEPFQGTTYGKSKFSLGARGIVKIIAALDILYAMVLIALHLLTLITKRRHDRKRSFQIQYNYTKASTHNVTSETVDPSPTATTHAVLTLDMDNSTYKSREILAVLIWVGLFALCILQLLVASALYGGTKQKESRICIRNCRIWSYTATFLILVTLLQMSWILIGGRPGDELLRIFVYATEIILRLVGILAIQKLKAELRNEQCDFEATENQTPYYELQQRTPSPSPHKGNVPCGHPRPSKRHYHRAEVWDDLDFDDV